MPDHRRCRVPGGTYVFTINLLERRSDLLVRHIDALREAVRRTRRERPFAIDAWVVLPEGVARVELWSILVYDLGVRFGQAASRCSSGGLSGTGIPSW